MIFNVRFHKIFRIKIEKLRYIRKNRLFEEIKAIIFNLLRYLVIYYEAEDEGTTIFTLGTITGLDVNILEFVISDLIVEKRVYESKLHEYRSY